MTRLFSRKGSRRQAGRHLLLLIVAAVLSLAMTAGAQVMTVYLRPFRLLHYSAIDTLTGPQGRYGVALIEDREVRDTCLAVITDNTTGQIAAVTVPAESCLVRNGR